MRKKDHVIVTEVLFKKGYDEVHEWLDELYTPNLGFQHWKTRHHLRAIEEKYGVGTKEYHVAILHVLLDWVSHLRIYAVPADEDEVELWLKDNMVW